MCGILGMLRRGSICEEEFLSALDTIAHRGPDDSGYEIWTDQGVALGHRRLSIIDLSSAGRNPIQNEDGNIWIVLNGEIYNYQVLRTELERHGHFFRSNSDTEVILHAYEQWGDSHVNKLRGMFAYAIYDRRGNPDIRGGSKTSNSRLILVRDRIGIKPLFYYKDREKIIFSSEIKAILSCSDVDDTIDKSALFDYLTYLYIPAPKTAYAMIRKIPPAHMLIIEEINDLRLQEYWDIPLGDAGTVRTIDDASEMVLGILKDAVYSHMVSDVPVGSFLSGGLDSSTITAIMSGKTGSPVQTFSVGFDVEEHSELEYSRLMSAHLKTAHRESTVHVGSIQELLPYVSRLYDEPYADGSTIPMLRVAEIASRHVKVVLSGDGGDEVFAGYNWYAAWLKRQALAKLKLNPQNPSIGRLALCPFENSRIGRMINYLMLGDVERYGKMLSLFSPKLKRLVIGQEYAKEFMDYDDYWYFRQYWKMEQEPLLRAQYLDIKTYLPNDILTKVDRTCMAFSLEARPPFLDHILMEKVFGLPRGLRAPSGADKALLKRAVKHLVPSKILNRNKKGFSAPWDQWMTEKANWAKGFLANGEAVRQGVLSPVISRYLGTEIRGIRIWGLLVLEQWLRDRVKRCHPDN